MAQIIVFGSSTVEGVGDPVGGWVDRLKHELHQHNFNHGVFNLGVGGQTSQEVLASLPGELATRAWPDTKNLCIISVGTNDSRADGEPEKFISTIEDYKSRLAACAEAAQHCAMVLLVGLTPVDDAKTRPYDTTYFSSERVRQFELAMAEVAQNAGVRMIPLFDELAQTNWWDYLYKDGLHLNAAGHEWVLNRVRPVVQEMIQ